MFIKLIVIASAAEALPAGRQESICSVILGLDPRIQKKTGFRIPPLARLAWGGKYGMTREIDCRAPSPTQ
ncbi:MAG: hypothetical protein AAB621_02210 [Patescibacteria group bacterium]